MHWIGLPWLGPELVRLVPELVRLQHLLKVVLALAVLALAVLAQVVLHRVDPLQVALRLAVLVELTGRLGQGSNRKAVLLRMGLIPD